MNEFSEFIFSLGLMDIPLEGGKFTWSNNYESPAMSRIDRFLYSGDWEDRYPTVVQKRPPKLLSDHFPILLESGKFLRGKRPFRFENMWLQAEGFGEMVRGWWESYQVDGTPSFILAKKLKALKLDLKKWNEKVFGNVGHKRNQLMLQLNQFDVLVEDRLLSEDENFQKERIRAELERNALMEEISWRLKSWALWLREGDKNTRFFHCLANSHRRNNSITTLLINGELSSEPDVISDCITQFYPNLFTKVDCKRPLLDGLEFTMLSIEDDVGLEKPFEEDEVTDVLHCFVGDKAPGPDGFPMAFFQFCGNIVRSNIMQIDRLRQGDPSVLCKLDVEKAYDHVNWDFLLYLLQCCGFPIRWRNWIRFCISTVRFSILINGCPSGFFASSRGLRQGDPLSPLLFVVVMEALSRLMDRAVARGSFSGFLVGNQTGSEGLKINLGKSKMVLVGAVPNLEELAAILGWWKKLYLSKGGKVTLIKSTLSNLPTYFLSLFPILVGVAHWLEKLQWDFLWSGLGTKFKFHLRYGLERDALWRRVVEAKYGSLWGGWCSKEVKGSYGLCLWKSIRKEWETFSNHLYMQVDDGVMIRFWQDRWCGEEPLRLTFPELFSIAREKDASIANLLSFEFGMMHWNLSFIRNVHDWELESLISFMDCIYASPLKGEGEDRICWESPSHSLFAVKRYYQSLTPRPSIPFPWKSIWKAKVPPLVAFFSWIATLGKTLTIDNLRKRDFILQNWCCMCKRNEESVDHLFLHCSVARDMWSMVLGMFGVHWVMPRSVLDLFSCWMGRLGRNDSVLVWKMILHCLIWCLWRE
uniref:Reverse transcriptase domain-containing protein n=1 Tax=Fagus sylvatica TaxID=28930 RepID=A0A2N9FE24_FAGSY